jgi:hypothetical protein
MDIRIVRARSVSAGQWDFGTFLFDRIWHRHWIWHCHCATAGRSRSRLGFKLKEDSQEDYPTRAALLGSMVDTRTSF